MEKHWSAASLLALTLLGCLAGTNVEAQNFLQKPATPMSKGAPPAHAPPFLQPSSPVKAPQFPQGRPVQPLLPSTNLQYPQNPQVPQVQPPPPAKVPHYPHNPQVPQVLPPPSQGKVVPRPQTPQVLPVSLPYSQTPKIQPPPPPKISHYPQAPQVQQPSPPKVPHPQVPQVQHPQQPKVPHPQVPQVQHPPSSKVPNYPQVPQVQHPSSPKVPTYPQAPKVQHPQPPKVSYPQVPQVQHPSAPKVPDYPQAPQVQHPSSAKVPNYPQAPKVQHPQPPKITNYPQVPQVQHPSSPKVPNYPQAPQVQYPSPPKVPNYPQVPQVQHPSPPKVPNYPQVPQVRPPQPQVRPLQPQVRPPQPQVRPPQPQVRPLQPQVGPLQPQVGPHQPQVRPPQPQVGPHQPQVGPLKPQVQPHQPLVRPLQPQVQPHQPLVRPLQPQVQPHQPLVRPLQPQVWPSQPQVGPHQPHVFPPPSSSRVSHQPQAPKFSGYPRAFSNFKSPQDPEDLQPQLPHQPTSPQAPSTYQPSAPKQPSFQSCEVEGSRRVPCGGPDISAGACEAISCCFDGRQCYFGKAVTIQCTKDAQFIVVVAKDATLPNIDLETISLLEGGQGCTHVDSNSDFAIYHFPVTACGSIVMEEPGVIIYENRMSSSYEVGIGPHGAITRDSYYELHFQCRYIGTSVETVVAEVLPLQDPPLPVAALGPIRVHLRLANGQCYTKGCNEVDVAYSSFYTEADYPVIKVLRDPVYVEVQLIEKTDPNLVLTLGRCWTTTSPNPHSMPQWDILTNGCPWTNDRYMSSLVPVGPSSGLDFPSHYRRFIFKMFTFVDASSLAPLKEQVYIHCSTAVCTAAMGHSCEPSCFRRKRDVETPDKSKAEPKVVVSVGPVIMTDPKREPAENVELKKIPENI